MTAMKISAAGIAAIKQREGSRTTAYPDTRGIWTIGVGHTGPEVHRGLVWTQEQVDAALEKDLGWAEAAINEGVTAPLTQNQFDALVSLTYNIGAGGFRGSSVRKQLNLRNYRAAAQDFLMWDKP
jgi:lysozyme